MKKYDVITSGYVSMDHIIRIKTPATVGFTSIVENQTNSHIYYGGCSVNIAYLLCKLGKNSMPILRVGDDFSKTGFKDYLKNGNVSCAGITIINGESSSTCYLLEDNNNEHITIFYPGAMSGKYSFPLNDSFFKESGLGVITVASACDNREFLEKCKNNQLPLVFGMKDDEDAFPEELLNEILLYSKIIFTNESERKTIEKRFNLSDITELFKKGNAEIIITTYGKKGSRFYEKQNNEIKTEHIDICHCNKVVDATGSGDAYIAGFLYGYLSNMKTSDCCMLGGTLSSFIIEKEGCTTNAPTKDELFERFNSQK